MRLLQGSYASYVNEGLIFTMYEVITFGFLSSCKLLVSVVLASACPFMLHFMFRFQTCCD